MLRPFYVLFATLLLLIPLGGHPRAEVRLPDRLVVEPRTRLPYEPWMLNRMDSLRERDPPAVLLGDSLVAAWPADLATKLLSTGAINLGANSDTTANLLWRIRRSFSPGMRTKAALLLVGTNDLPYRSGQDIAAVVEVIASEVLASAPGVCLTVVGLLPRRDGRADFDAKIRDANRHLAMLRRQGVRFVDPYDGLRASCPASEACPLYKDAVHLTRAGYELLTSLVADADSGRSCLP